MRFDLSNLGITKPSKSTWIVVDCGYSVDCFGEPERQVGDLTCELMGILCREALKLIRDQRGSFDGIRRIVSPLIETIAEVSVLGRRSSSRLVAQS